VTLTFEELPERSYQQVSGWFQFKGDALNDWTETLREAKRIGAVIGPVGFLQGDDGHAYLYTTSRKFQPLHDRISEERVAVKHAQLDLS